MGFKSINRLHSPCLGRESFWSSADASPGSSRSQTGFSTLGQWASDRTPYPLKQCQALLPGNRFLKVHQRYLLNRQFIERISYEMGVSYLLVKTGLKVTVSRRRLSYIEQALAASEGSWLS